MKFGIAAVFRKNLGNATFSRISMIGPRYSFQLYTLRMVEFGAIRIQAMAVLWKHNVSQKSIISIRVLTLCMTIEACWKSVLAVLVSVLSMGSKHNDTMISFAEKNVRMPNAVRALMLMSDIDFFTLT